MQSFKSEIHRALFHRMLILEIRTNLIKRFGGTRQEECRILRNKSSKQLISEWAYDILSRLPYDSTKQSEFIKNEINIINENVLSQAHIKKLLKEDKSLRWLVDRITNGENHVPKPYYPSVLCNSMLQYPFKPSDIDKSREMYGLLKFPFYSLTSDIYHESSEKFKKLSINHIDEDNTDVKYSTSNQIYSPSELETGLHNRN